MKEPAKLLSRGERDTTPWKGLWVFHLHHMNLWQTQMALSYTEEENQPESLRQRRSKQHPRRRKTEEFNQKRKSGNQTHCHKNGSGKWQSQWVRPWVYLYKHKVNKQQLCLKQPRRQDSPRKSRRKRQRPRGRILPMIRPSLSWNCRGAGSHSKMAHLRRLIRNQRPMIVALQETKKGGSFTDQDIRRLLGRKKWGWAQLGAESIRGTAGGLLTAWDQDHIKVLEVLHGAYTLSITAQLLQVLAGFEPKERCMLLKFVTSCSRAPLLGFKHLHPAFTIHKVPCSIPLWATIGGQDVDRLPSASTCYNTLKLPTYKRASTLREKLLYAISSNAGFELS